MINIIVIMHLAVRIKAARKWWIKRTQLAEDLVTAGTASSLKDIGSFFVVYTITFVLFFGAPATCFLRTLTDTAFLFSRWPHTWIEDIFDDFKRADNVCLKSELRPSLGLCLRF